MRRYVLNSLWIIIFLMLPGCAPAPYVYKPITIEHRQKSVEGTEASNEQDKAALAETVKTLSYDQKAPARPPSPRQPLSVQKLKAAEGPVSINVNRMRLPEFVIYVIGETMKIPFVMDQAMMEDKRVVTLSTPQPVPADKALEMVVGVLEKHDLIVEEKAGALHVMQKPPAPRPTSDIQTGREIVERRGDVLQIVPLRFLRVSEIQSLITDLSRGSVQIKPYARENVLILHGSSNNIQQIIDFINFFDVPSLHEKKVVFLRLIYWQPEEFISQLTRMLEGMGIAAAKTPKDPGPMFVAIRQMNAVLVIAPDEATMKYVIDWKNRLDTVEAAGSDEKAYTFAPQFSRASDIVNSVLALYGITPRSDTVAPGRDASSRPASASSTGYQTTGQGFQTPVADAQTSTTFGGSITQAASGKTASSGAAFSAAALPNLKIAADNNKNVVIMICSPTVYRQHLEILRQLDTQTKQVLIEATVAELSLTDELKYGVEWYINNTINGGPITGGTLGNLGINTLGMTFSYATATANFKAMLNALATKDKANILSTPRLTVLDNHEAIIQIGQDVPIATGEQTTASSTTENPTIQRSIQYRSLGIILRVKPTINTEGLLTLELTQEVSDLSPTTGISDSPIILIRRINTSVVAAHGQTVALGGLMRERKAVKESKIPFLGDIPVIGNLFKVTENTTERTELLVLVTPTILTKTDDATKITDELKKELKWMKF
ncbi:MAG TPA: secretin N-terminal domain-containing protein [Syntrophales bacterium]|nr:secretin N-terminal domain-containing protein [Syntrophales bacterium]